MSITFAKFAKNIIKSQKIGRETNVHKFNWNCIIPPSTMAAPSAFQSKDTLKNYFSSLATSAQKSLRYWATSITRLALQPKKLDPVEATIPSLDSKGIKGFQAIVVAVLLCGQAVDKKTVGGTQYHQNWKIFSHWEYQCGHRPTTRILWHLTWLFYRLQTRKYGSCYALWCRIPQLIKGTYPSRRPHLPFQRWNSSTLEWSHLNHCPNHQVFHVIIRRSWTWRPLCHNQRNSVNAPKSDWDGLVPTPFANKNE